MQISNDRLEILQVNALIEWIIGIYLHNFDNNEREISTPHKALPSKVRIENFEFTKSMMFHGIL